MHIVVNRMQSVGNTKWVMVEHLTLYIDNLGQKIEINKKKLIQSLVINE